ncbi:alpha/beta hydrolase family protein [Lentzea sp. NPDC059081]|uniref:alpha/beta hydrolase family protein n=1 Tax=Lentzea sp. NPDC059081 TaxID=3346719 RepID=UPI00369A0022
MIVLFAAGGGGDPERHRPLLDHLTAAGCEVVAPRFDRLMPGEASNDDLLARPRGLVEALEGTTGEVTVVGHSIGGWAALCLAGATPWGRDRRPLDVPRSSRVARLVLFAPATGWFVGPHAVDDVHVPVLAYAGTADTVTPPLQVEVLRKAPGPVEIRVVPGAGHFSFMNTLPPTVPEDPDFDRPAFLEELAAETAEFILRGGTPAAAG